MLGGMSQHRETRLCEKQNASCEAVGGYLLGWQCLRENLLIPLYLQRCNRCAVGPVLSADDNARDGHAFWGHCPVSSRVSSHLHCSSICMRGVIWAPAPLPVLYLATALALSVQLLWCPSCGRCAENV